MLSYQHAYHAGNHADVLKHAALSLCLESLLRKDKPFFALDTHAGRGRYDLRDMASRKTAEAAAGIEKLWPVAHDAFPALYADSLRRLNPGPSLRYYPGSCQIIADHLRKQDHAVFCERHPAEFEALLHQCGDDPFCQLRFDDGFTTTQAVLPPQAGRGLILIDPSYETGADYKQVPKVVAEIHRRFRAGIVMVWFPVIARSEGLGEALLKIADRGVRTVMAELRVRSALQSGMGSSAVFILNAPWQMDDALQAFLNSALYFLADDEEAKADVLRYGD